jgi:16S rRNA (cytosine967-C5)-methyltransferase
MKEQVTVLDNAALAVKLGGRLVYITCSVLPEENDQQITDFLARTPGFSVLSIFETPAFASMPSLETATRTTQHGLMLTPLRAGCDGFYMSMLQRMTG